MNKSAGSASCRSGSEIRRFRGPCENPPRASFQKQGPARLQKSTMAPVLGGPLPPLTRAGQGLPLPGVSARAPPHPPGRCSPGSHYFGPLCFLLKLFFFPGLVEGARETAGSLGFGHEGRLLLQGNRERSVESTSPCSVATSAPDLGWARSRQVGNCGSEQGLLAPALSGLQLVAKAQKLMFSSHCFRSLLLSGGPNIQRCWDGSAWEAAVQGFTLT